jgi:hypothetical protein
MKNFLLTLFATVLLSNIPEAQSCNPQGNQTSYGTNNVWIGYVYKTRTLNQYVGYVNEGNAASPDFDQNFGGDNVQYSTNGCKVTTYNFSVRYKLRKTFANARYTFQVGGDDGYRLSLDGGQTWIINRWNDQSFTTSTYSVNLNGTYDMVLEFYENGGANRISFQVTIECAGTENTSSYGSGNAWNGYIYDGTNFEVYRGMIQRGNSLTGQFDESFGGSNTTFATSGCSQVETETFSVRFRLRKTFTSGTYTFFVGGDDGYRLSLDGGQTWVIDRWVLQSYNLSTYNTQLNGTYDLVLEYYENSGDNRINFHVEGAGALPIRLVNFTARNENGKANLDWEITRSSNPEQFEIQKSYDGRQFTTAGRTGNAGTLNSRDNYSFRFVDANPGAARVYYRVRMIDQQGVETFTNTVIVSFDEKAGMQLYPNVLRTAAPMSLRTEAALQNASLMIVDMNGRILSTQAIGKMMAGSTIQVETSRLGSQKGVFFVRVLDQQTVVSTQRFVIQ